LSINDRAAPSRTTPDAPVVATTTMTTTMAAGGARRRDAQARFEDDEPFLDVSIISHYEKQLHSGIKDTVLFCTPSIIDACKAPSVYLLPREYVPII